MLENVKFEDEKMDKEAYKAQRDELVSRLVVLQERAGVAGVGMVVLFEGWSGAGKGSRISDLLYNLDARNTSVCVTEELDRGDLSDLHAINRDVMDYYPFLQPFWKELGPRGNITFFDRGWYMSALQHFRFDPAFSPVEAFADKKGAQKAAEKRRDMLQSSVGSFEKQLVDDGYIVKKFFLHISHETQEKRLRKLASDPNTAWRVDEDDLRQMASYRDICKTYDAMLENSDFPYAPWIVLNGADKRAVNLTVLRELVQSYEQALSASEDPAAAAAAAKAAANSAAQGAKEEWKDERSRSKEEQKAIEKANEKEAAKQAKAAPKKSAFAIAKDIPDPDNIATDLALDDPDSYKPRLKELQARLYELETLMYRKRVPLIIMYEGWDAAGKGGNIKRVAQALDARSYTIFPSPAPTKPELMHPFLWRYWTRLPKAGHVGIYDRSWYGRVLVERVEGFASDEEWSRAYDEINEFERDLQDWGAILLKFWVNTSREEQLARFEARENDPAKQWKITAEDWRNRDKFPQYREAVRDMFRLTSTKNAPWIILESDDKHFARIKALEIIVDALEKRLL